MPERISASGMFGVRTSASGRSFSHSAVTASSRNSFAPDVATMTGSTTMCFAPYSFNFAAIVSISSAEDTMPILTASGKMSVNTASSCSARKCGVESKMSVTPVVFWAVRAVTAHRAKTPLAVMVLMSAWIPAPPLESLPAMVNAVLMVITSSYYKVVVIRVPLQGQNATIDKVLWIGLNLLPQDGFGKAPTTALCF